MTTTKATTKRRTRVESGIYRRPDGVLEIGWRDAGGKQRWRAVEGGIKAARAALATEHAKRANGERVAPPRLTFGLALDTAWQQRRARLARSSQAVYRASMRRVRRRFASRRLDSISAGDLAAYIAAHERLSAETVGKDLTVISMAFTYAIRHLGFAGSNPVLLLDRFERPQGERKRKRILGPVELRKLLMATEPRYRLALRFMAETGVRLSELLGLAWGDLDLDSEMVEVTYQLDPQTHGRVRLKTARSRRALAITGQLADALADARPDGAGRHDLVFCEPNRRPWTQKQIERAVGRAAKRAGLGEVKSGENVIEHAPTPHDLRHSHASALVADSWDVESVSRRLGHANAQITLSTYTHEFESAQRRDEQRRSLVGIYGSAMEAPAPDTTRSGRRPEARKAAQIRAIRSETG